MYRGFVRPCMEYACHVWGGSTHTSLLDRVESKAFRLIRSTSLTSCLLPLNSRRDVAFLSILYRYFHANCSSELANCMPPLLSRPRHTLLPFKSRRDVAFLSIFYRYVHANCFSELANCMPPLLPRPRHTRHSSQAHSYIIQTPFATLNLYRDSFFLSTGRDWNRLPASIFPPVYDLNAFKRGLSRHLCN